MHCLDIEEEWSPALTIRTLVTSLRSLLASADLDDPNDSLVAAQYKNNKEEFDRTAAEWTRLYAVPAEVEERRKIDDLLSCGFALEEAQAALQQSEGDLDQALNLLLG